MASVWIQINVNQLVENLIVKTSKNIPVDSFASMCELFINM